MARRAVGIATRIARKYSGAPEASESGVQLQKQQLHEEVIFYYWHSEDGLLQRRWSWMR